MMGNSLLNVGGLSGVGLPNKRYNLKLKVFADQPVSPSYSQKISSVNTVIENYDTALNDPSVYKMFCLRWRRGKWKAASLFPQGCPNNFDEHGIDKWSITGREQEWPDFAILKATFKTRQRPNDYKYTFKSSRSTTLKVGCAVYKYTGEGTWGWQRVSNIAYFQLHAKSAVNDYRFSVHQE